MSPHELRQEVVRLLARAEAGHVPSNLSVVEIIYTLFLRVMRLDPSDPTWPDRDRFIASKAHCAATLYLTMSEAGFFGRDRLAGYNVNGSDVPPIVAKMGLPGIETDAGLGRGVSLAIGIALAAKNDGREYKTYVMVGDGECQEGQIWEAVMLAPTLGLDNLVMVVDANGMQSTVGTSAVAPTDLGGRLAAFGWETLTVDGHSVDELEAALRLPQAGPKAVVAQTVKGKGIKMMESNPAWHGRRLTFPELVTSLRELK